MARTTVTPRGDGLDSASGVNGARATKRPKKSGRNGASV